MKNAWKKVMQNVRLSAAYGSAGGRHIQDLKKGGFTQEEIDEIVDTRYGGNKEINIDHIYLESLFHKQNGRCAYLKTIIEPMDVFIPHHPLAPSVDRINNGLDYTKGNVVIATRFANRGKESAGDNWFKEHCLPRLADGLWDMRQLPNIEDFYDSR
jgi:hypothetical protein